MNKQNLRGVNELRLLGLRVGPVWLIVLYVLLAASAGFAWYTQRAPVSYELALLTPWIFLAFTLGFSFYRIALVAAGRYTPFKAFLQISIAALFFMLLLWQERPVPPKARSALTTALTSADPEKRALAAELAGFRGDVAIASTLLQLLTDSVPEVRAAAHAALVKMNDGVDLGPAENEQAQLNWERRFQ